MGVRPYALFLSSDLCGNACGLRALFHAAYSGYREFGSISDSKTFYRKCGSFCLANLFTIAVYVIFVSFGNCTPYDRHLSAAHTGYRSDGGLAEREREIAARIRCGIFTGLALTGKSCCESICICCGRSELKCVLVFCSKRALGINNIAVTIQHFHNYFITAVGADISVYSYLDFAARCTNIIDYGSSDITPVAANYLAGAGCNLDLENVIGLIHVTDIVLTRSRNIKCVNIGYIILSCSGSSPANFAA